MELNVDDRLAIQDLLAKYQVWMDRQDVAWVELFDEDAVLLVQGRDPVIGADELGRFFRAAPRGVHLASPPVIRADAADSARSTQTFLFRNAETEELRTGWYDDELVRRGGTWRFKVRRVAFFGD